jgi:hypothetical protein
MIVSTDDRQTRNKEQRVIEVNMGGKRRAYSGSEHAKIHPFRDRDSDERRADQSRDAR